MKALRFAAILACVSQSALLWGQATREALPPEVLTYASWVLHNGKIVTMDDRTTRPVPGTVFEAIAIRDGKVLKLGPDDDVLRLAGPETRRIDLKGRTVIPGLIDTHSHLHDYSEHWGMPAGIRPVVNVRGNTPEELARNILAALKEAVATAKPGEWIRMRIPPDPGFDLINRQRKFKRGDVDSVARANPVIVSGGVNTLLVNGKAIETVEDFYRSHLVDEALDRESGIATFTTEFIRALPGILLKDQVNILTDNILRELQEWPAFGITTFSSHINVPVHVNAYAQLNRKGLMPMRFAWTHRSGTIFNWDQASGFYTRVGDLAGSGSDHWWNIGATVGHLDLSYPALATSIPAAPEIKGREVDLSKPGDPKRQVMFDMVRSGLRITGTHIAGDRALEKFLDIIEEGSRAAGMSVEQIREKGHVIDHCTLGPRPEQYERLKRLGVIMSCGPKYIPSVSPRVLRDYGEKYLSWTSPMKSLIESGVKTVWEIDAHEPAQLGAFYFLELAVTRKGPDGRVWAPSEKLDRVIALKAATSWASEYVLRPDVLGTLEAGKWADFLILNQDYFTLPEEQISDVRPLMTVVGGKISYLDPGLASELGLSPAGIQPKFAK